MLRQLFLVALMLFSQFLIGQIKEVPGQKTLNYETLTIDSVQNLFAISSFNDSTSLNKYDTISKSWTTLSTIYIGSNTSLVGLRSELGWGGAIYLSGLKDTNSYSIFLTNQSSWKRLGKMYKSSFSSKGNFYHKFYRFKNEVYFVTNADSIGGHPNGHVFKVTPNGLINMNFNVSAPEYHMIMRNDTLIVGANATMYYYSNPNWITYKKLPSQSSNYIRGMVLKQGSLIYCQNDLYLKQLNSNYIDSALIGTQGELTNVANVIYLTPRATAPNYTVYKFDTIHTVEIAFKLKGSDSLPLKIVSDNKKAYMIFESNHTIRADNKVMGRIAELQVGKYSISYYDSVWLAPFLDHNKNLILDAGDEIVSVNFSELYGDLFLTNPPNNRLLYKALDNEYICFVAPKNLSTDSCYELTFSGARCSNHYKSPISNDTLYYPYQTRESDGIRNVRVNVAASGNARIDLDKPMQIELYRSDCDFSNVTGQVDIYLPDSARLSNSIPNFITRVNNKYTYDFSLGPNASKFITFNVFYPSNYFNYGTNQTIKAEVVKTTNEFQLDNADSAIHYLKYSFDPNQKICVPEGRINYGLKSIRFHIDFQNEGNDYAKRVVVIDTLNLKIPVYEFKILSASHQYVLSHKDNVVTWTFNDINLMPKMMSEELSKGFIEFEAKVNGEFRVGDSIVNNALIYFDNNEPIITNFSHVKRVTGFNTLQVQNLLDIYPNPISNQFNIINKSESILELAIYDIQGRLIQELSVEAGQKQIISSEQWSPGIYMVYIKGIGDMMIIKG
ncbi:MAG: T9SS type A sorting domain-containing protein [Bacteroidia bacterium]|nr:T9SS type A sorting domain-containing protein [Bacteroidia bacterium]